MPIISRSSFSVSCHVPLGLAICLLPFCGMRASVSQRMCPMKRLLLVAQITSSLRSRRKMSIPPTRRIGYRATQLNGTELTRLSLSRTHQWASMASPLIIGWRVHVHSHIVTDAEVDAYCNALLLLAHSPFRPVQFHSCHGPENKNAWDRVHIAFPFPALFSFLFTRESSYCFQRVLAIAILSVCPSIRLFVRHTGRPVKNGAR